MIQLHTLGDAVITIGDREVRPTSPTLFGALLYLGVERGQRVPRAALQELLFPETDERSGAHSMRQLLYKLRQLGVSVQAEGDVVWLASEDVTDDYSAPAHTNGNGSGGGNGNGNGSRGVFLAGYAPRLSRAFDEWLESRRSAVEASRRRALIKYMLERRGVADWITVERVAQDVLVTDPFNEEATFALAESTALGGSKSEAVRILERYESETGRADLKLPSSILRKRISERLPDRRRRALDTPFVGRDAEMGVMRQAVVNLRAGIGGSIVISGEPGIGKTRLLEETSALALLEGVNVHVVRCQPHYVSRPMGVFIEWIPMLMQSRGALGVDPETLEHLKLLTSHRDDRPNRPTDARDDATRSGTLMAGIRDLVDAVTNESPVLLIIEDAHWADSVSLTELCTVLEKRRGAALLLVHSTRAAEPLREAGVLTETTLLLRLKPLGDASMQLLSTCLLLPNDFHDLAKLREWCARTAGGNPFYLQMLCAHFEDTRQPFSVPPSLRAVTMRRLEQLPHNTRRILELCALLGRHATSRNLRALSELTSSALTRAVQDLEEAGMLTASKDFAQLGHDLMRECALEMLPPLTLQLLNATVAQHLDAEYEATLDSSLLWDAAEHWSASGESSKALRSAIQCAKHAAYIGQASHAFSLLQTGQKFAVSHEEMLLVLDHISVAAKHAHRWGEVLAATARARELLESRGTSLPWQWRLRAIEARFGASLDLDDGNSIAILLQCLETADVDKLHRLHAAQLLVRIAHERLDPDLAHRAFNRVAEFVDERSLDYATRMLPLMYHTSFGDRATAAVVVEGILSDLHRFEITDELRIVRNVSVALANLAQPSRAVDLSSQYYDRATRLGLPDWQYDFATNCCCAYTAMNEFADARHWFDRANQARTRASQSLVVDYSHFCTGIEIACYTGDRLLAESLAKESAALSPSSERFRAMAMGSKVLIAQLDKTYLSTDAELAELATTFVSANQFGCGDLLAHAYCEALARRGQFDRARAAVSDFLKIRRDNGKVPDSLLRFLETPPQTRITRAESD